MQTVKSSKIEIPSIHQVNGTRFPEELVEDIDFVNLSAGDDDHCRNAAAQIQQSVQFDSRFSSAKLRPRKKREAEVDGGGIQRVDRLIEFESEGLLSVEVSRSLDKHMGKIGIDSPVANLIGIGQSVPRNLTANAHMVELGWRRSQTRLDISEALSKRQLGKGQGEKLIPARKALDFVIALVTLYTAAKFVRGNKVHQLSKDCFAAIHPS